MRVLLVSLVLLIVSYIIVVHTRNHISLPGRLGMILGMIGGLLLGSYILALGAPVGVRFWPLPILFAVALALFVGARLDRLYKDSFGKK